MAVRFANLLGRRRAEEECIEARGLSSDFIDGEVDSEAARKVKAHLSRCRLCRAFFSTLSATIDLLESARDLGAPPAFRERLLHRLRGKGAV
jgi:anti-sigma factor RsiW